MSLEQIIKKDQDILRSKDMPKEKKQAASGRIEAIGRMVDRGYSAENIRLMIDLDEKEMDLAKLEREHEDVKASPAYQQLSAQISTLRTQADGLDHFAKHMERVKKDASKQIDAAYAKEYAQQAAWYQEDKKRLQDWVMKTMLKHIEGGATPPEQEVLRQEALRRHYIQRRSGIPSLGVRPEQQGITPAHLNPNLPDVEE